MALGCVHGSRECNGCMRCQYVKRYKVGNCEHCSDVIYKDDNYYDIDGEMVHYDCLREWARKFEVNP